MNTRLSKTILDPKFEGREAQRLNKHMMSNSTLVMETQISWLIWEGSHLSEIFLHFKLKILDASMLLSWFFHKYNWLDNRHWLKISRIIVLCSIIIYTLHQVNLNQFKVIIFPLPSNTYQGRYRSNYLKLTDSKNNWSNDWIKSETYSHASERNQGWHTIGKISSDKLNATSVQLSL